MFWKLSCAAMHIGLKQSDDKDEQRADIDAIVYSSSLHSDFGHFHQSQTPFSHHHTHLSNKLLRLLWDLIYIIHI